MVKGIENFSDEERLIMMLYGVSYPMMEASQDRNYYEEFKLGQSEQLSEENLRDMNLLSILEKLGYPLDELGTYLYKDVIAEVYEFLKGISKRSDMEKCRNMLSQLNDSYSQFYHNIARGNKEMGINAFHLYIQNAIDKIQEDSINKKLSSKIFGKKTEELTYGTQAFLIASYTSNLYSCDNVEEYSKPVVKSLSNISNDMRLKAKF